MTVPHPAADRVRVVVAAPGATRSDDPLAPGDGVIGVSGAGRGLDPAAEIVAAVVADVAGRRDDVALTLLPAAPARRDHVAPNAAQPDTAGPAALLRRVRADRRLPARRAAEALARGTADAAVCVGDAGLAVAAATFVLGPLRGATGPSLAAVVRAPDRLVLWCDVTPGRWPTREQGFVDAALARSAAIALGTPDPHVVVLTAGDPPAAAPALADLPAADAAIRPGRLARLTQPAAAAPDVVLTDGVTGAALLEARALGDPSPCRLVLGVSGVLAVTAADERDVADAIDVAVRCVRGGLVERGREVLAAVVADRRRAAGLAPDLDPLAGSAL